MFHTFVRKQESVPVIVVGGSLNALGVVRSLSHGNMAVTVLETSRRCPSFWSRHCHFLTAPSLEGRPLIEKLKSIAGKHDKKPVLLLTDDRAVETVSKFRSEIEPLFQFNLPSVDMVENLADKVLFHELAERMGLPVPRSVIIQNTDELALLKTLSMPVVIKPARKSLVLNGKVAGVGRGQTQEQAFEVAARMLAEAGSLIVQEWIVGPDTGIFFSLFVCSPDGKITGFFSGRKVVCDPPGVGNTGLCVEAAQEPAAELMRLTEQFISLVGYQGIGGMEYKRDIRTGRFMIIEPTIGRTDWQEEIATLCGVNIPLVAYHSILANPLTQTMSRSKPASARAFAWRSSWTHQPPNGELVAGTRLMDGYFRFTDPLPGFYYYGFERFFARIGRFFLRPFLRLITIGKQDKIA